MDTPHQLRSAANEQDDITITRREYDDEDVVAIDFGPSVEVELDVVGDTAIVIAGEDQFEFEIPADASGVEANDGMLVIRAKRASD